MDQATVNDLTRYLKDAEEKLAAIPARQAEEDQLAEVLERKSAPIVPLTEVDPKVLSVALAEITNCSPGLKEAHRVVSRTCKKFEVLGIDQPINMRSDQLVGLLNAAGITSKQQPTKPE